MEDRDRSVLMAYSQYLGYKTLLSPLLHGQPTSGDQLKPLYRSDSHRPVRSWTTNLHNLYDYTRLRIQYEEDRKGGLYTQCTQPPWLHVTQNPVSFNTKTWEQRGLSSSWCLHAIYGHTCLRILSVSIWETWKQRGLSFSWSLHTIYGRTCLIWYGNPSTSTMPHYILIRVIKKSPPLSPQPNKNILLD